ncbi:MAG: hypothetical protein ACREDD_09340 [Methylocella sp.]
MGIIKFALRAAGILAVLIGLVWVGQGTGYFPYPASSFMINQRPWVYRGVILAALGLISVAISRRI